MDLKERLRRINANSFYGVGQIDRDLILKEAEDILRRKKMAEKSNSEWFVKTVENTANSAIAAGRNVNEVIHDMIEVIYGRKNINELLPSGWIVVSHICFDCAYNQVPHTDKPCFRCYNRFFDDLDEGPYTDNFEPKEEKDAKDKKDHEEQKHVEVEDGKYCYNCKYEELKTHEQPCYNCYWNAARPSFTPKEEE